LREIHQILLALGASFAADEAPLLECQQPTGWTWRPIVEWQRCADLRIDAPSVPSGSSFSVAGIADEEKCRA
jgi:hypothetical protein